MPIKVKFFARLREIAKTPEIEINVNDKMKLVNFIHLLADKFGSEFREYVFSSENRIGNHVILMVNGEPVKNLELYLEENDILAMLPPVSGGIK